MAVPGIGNGALSRLVERSASLKAQLGTLSAQSVDGRRGSYYGDLGGGARQAISLRGEIARREAHVGGIDRALGRAAIAQEALKRLSAVAEGILSEAGKITRADTTRITALAAEARQAVTEVGTLLNERHDGAYLFGGADSASPPIPDPGGMLGTDMAAGIAAAVAGLTPGNAAAVLSATLSAATSVAAGETPFSDYLLDPARGLTEPRRTTLAEDGQAVGTGLFASRNADAAPAGSETGSWSRDLLRGLMTLAGLTPAQAAAGSGFDAVMANVRGGLEAAMDGLGEEAGSLGRSESRLEAAKARHAELRVGLSSQLAGVEEVDLAATLAAMQDTQNRLQASWQAISRLSGLSLTQFLR